MDPPVVTIAVTGNVDGCTVRILEGALDRALGHRPDRVVVDLTGVRSLTVDGVTALIEATARANENSCAVYLRGVRPNVVKELGMYGPGRAIPHILGRGESPRSAPGGVC